MELIKTTLDILEKDRINNISLINFIKNNRIFSTEIIGNSVLVRGESDRKWVYISSRDKAELFRIKDKLTIEDENFAAIDDWMKPVLTMGRKVLWELETIQFYLPDEVHMPDQEIRSVTLKKNDARAVYENSEYKDYISVEYVKDRIIHGISAGIYDRHKLVCWSISQDDGAIGFLHTLDNYRRRGYGYNVTLAMIEKVRNMKELPFAYVKKQNKRSINLLLKLGFKENKIIHWFQIR